ncbi:hypothetical protein [Mycoplasmopsis arginini]|uniref:Uncharacterized protein n=1 Tax=Mycoplasmopsis arginini TaxID=2094 RepID=A0AA43QZ16_MYCAR|nr:hypothetical protein [Mycoplasmopsis arginini]MDI3349906.1 hypothetical protein [Mycoplasmopsis arginini]
MASFSVDDIDIDPVEFMNECSRWEIDEVIEWLIERDHINSKNSNSDEELNHNDNDFLRNVDAIGKSKHLLSVEEEDIINRIGGKFKHLY